MNILHAGTWVPLAYQCFQRFEVIIAEIDQPMLLLEAVHFANVIVIAGSNKLVPTEADALTRTEQFALPMESARVRIAYKVPASAINNLLVIRGNNPWGKPGRIHIILIKEVLGF